MGNLEEVAREDAYVEDTDGERGGQPSDTEWHLQPALFFRLGDLDLLDHH